MRGGPSVGRRARRAVEQWVHHQIQTSSSARMKLWRSPRRPAVQETA
jgi:hypothetical protein